MEPETFAKQATPHAYLIAELMNPFTPKSEREHAAAREIERLRVACDKYSESEVLAEVGRLRAERYRLVGHLDCMLDYVCESNAWRMVGACSAIAEARATLDEISRAARSE